MTHRLGFVVLIPGIVIICSLAGCGGGSNGSGGNPPPATDFSVSVQPNSVSLGQGFSNDVQVSVTAINGFGGQVSISITGMPAGMTASPANFTLSPTHQQSVTLSAAANTSVGSTNL